MYLTCRVEYLFHFSIRSPSKGGERTLLAGRLVQEMRGLTSMAWNDKYARKSSVTNPKQISRGRHASQQISRAFLGSGTDFHARSARFFGLFLAQKHDFREHIYFKNRGKSWAPHVTSALEGSILVLFGNLNLWAT